MSAFAASIRSSFPAKLQQFVQRHSSEQWTPLAKHSQYNLRHLLFEQLHLFGATIGLSYFLSSKLTCFASDIGSSASFANDFVFFLFAIPKFGEKDPDSDDFYLVGYTVDPAFRALPNFSDSFAIILLYVFLVPLTLLWPWILILPLSSADRKGFSGFRISSSFVDLILIILLPDFFASLVSATFLILLPPILRSTCGVFFFDVLPDLLLASIIYSGNSLRLRLGLGSPFGVFSTSSLFPRPISVFSYCYYFFSWR